MHYASLGDMQIYGAQLDMIKAMHTEEVIALQQENDVKKQWFFTFLAVQVGSCNQGPLADSL